METIAAGAECAAPVSLTAPDAGAAPRTTAPLARRITPLTHRLTPLAHRLTPLAHRLAPLTRLATGPFTAFTALASLVRARSRWALTALMLVIAVAVTLALTGSASLRAATAAFGTMHWEFVPLLMLLSVLHYVFAAITLRGAAGRRLPLYEATLTQFTAAAANRVTPSGLGAVAVNTRYLVCQGVPLSRAAIAVTAMQVAGFPADLMLMGTVLGIDGGNSRMLDALGAHAAQAADLMPPWPVFAIAGVLLPLALLWGRRAMRSPAVGRTVYGLTELCRRPRDLAITLGASAATTFIMGLAFALSVLAVPGAAGPGDMVPLIGAYLVGAAAGAAIPAPGGLGSTEAALVAALAALGIGAGPAVQAVIIFRAVTFWAPVPVGLLACQTLKKRPALSLDPTSTTPAAATAATAAPEATTAAPAVPVAPAAAPEAAPA
ncbi:flippase-like domain-containing protein [Actinomadura barringtoniae]|uniref:Flippase-like domain-containing protein n=1 Tax=Actinomadura barringtoniae TaxID=1427535 RepID=A0A939TCB3_9ACTN|nr:lysylphosphatidylglycerol synthase domain-containing protein [Actinomadura barringtoniae]MBO2451060.1 flippase-like domain-containing protein [Actinomadura barringtoniae]